MDAVTVSFWMGLLPIAWLSIRRARGQRSAAVWWWVAGAFGISWIADLIAQFLPTQDRWAVSLVYPVSQTAIIGAVLLPRRIAQALLGCLAVLAIIAALTQGIGTPDLMLRAVAWLSIVATVWLTSNIPIRLQACLLVSFGLGLAAWMALIRWGSVQTWYAYQETRLAGLLLFCWAVSQESSTMGKANE
jgi:hypothetical protein